MNKVWVVSSGSYDDWGVDAIFSTKQLAKQFVAEYNKRASEKNIRLCDRTEYEIDDWELDESFDKIASQRYMRL